MAGTITSPLQTLRPHQGEERGGHCCATRAPPRAACQIQPRPQPAHRPPPLFSRLASPPSPLQDEVTSEPDDPAYQERKKEKKGIVKIPFILMNLWKKAFNKKKKEEEPAAAELAATPAAPTGEVPMVTVAPAYGVV